MKKIILLFLPLLILTSALCAQEKGSLDLGYLRNLHSGLNGDNISYYHHLTKKWSAGVECIRFFPATKTINGEEEKISAWDVEFNVHYTIPFAHHWKLYPITGVGHTSEKENLHGEIVMHRFWSFNTGAGLGMEMGHWSPHIEYNLGWGKINQQFFLVGLSYEIDWH
jgi:hypothetical protein